MTMAKNSASEKALSAKAMAGSALNLIDSRTKDVVETFAPKSFEKEILAKEVDSLVGQMADKFDKPMIPARIGENGKLIPGQNRIVLDEEALKASLLEASVFDKEIALPIQESAPNVSQEALTSVQQKVIGSYKTKFNPAVPGRSYNIALSAKAINQIVLGPGDRFYFNLIVGERSVERGYQKAMEIVNKEFVEGIGGGICQTSSTLYNAVERAGLEIIELHHHSKTVGYVPEGKDATVSWGGNDFKFLNNKEYPIIVKTIMDGKRGSLEVQLLAAVK
ncbi:vancomycin resistance protein [Bacillus sp. M6-12]|uniref:VanW family protein n=1 Tax=Bacillus sp. M6-12 TaxID=2054166 RepID=UPI000C763773|nr:VanW family protein [Bacillus sp. M6-12]PLS14808.1 vancomycin resistance protein [Bacillus sp. M6-12]